MPAIKMIGFLNHSGSGAPAVNPDRLRGYWPARTAGQQQIEIYMFRIENHLAAGTAVNGRRCMIVANVAQVVGEAATTRVTVIGKTDRVGAAPGNLALSRRRATAVRDSLIAAGIPAGRIDTSWTGEDRAAAPRDDNVARDRVVDITVVKTP